MSRNMSDFTLKLATLPTDALLRGIATFLSRQEVNRLFALCSAFLPLLRESRTIVICNASADRFLEDIEYRNTLLWLVGCSEGVVKRKLTLQSCGSEHPAEDWMPYLKYFEKVFGNLLRRLPQTQSDVVLLTKRNNDENKSPPLCRISVELAYSELHKLHRLRFNADNDILNLSVLKEEVLEEEKMSLSSLKHISDLTLTSLNTCDLTLNHGCDMRQVTLQFCDIPSDLSFISDVEHVKICNVSDVDWITLSTVRKLTLTHLSELYDLRPLAAVPTLSIEHCRSIQYYPIPTKTNQRWKFLSCNIQNLTGYDTLLTLELSCCSRVVDTSMLGKVRTLTIRECGGIRQFPIPSGEGQIWCFEYVNISDLTGYGRLSSLCLKACDLVTDLSPLRNIRSLQCSYLSNVEDVSALTQVTFLTFYNCPGICDVSMLHAVEELSLTQCRNVRSVDGLQNIFGRSVPSQFWSPVTTLLNAHINPMYY